MDVFGSNNNTADTWVIGDCLVAVGGGTNTLLAQSVQGQLNRQIQPLPVLGKTKSDRGYIDVMGIVVGTATITGLLGPSSGIENALTSLAAQCPTGTTITITPQITGCEEAGKKASGTVTLQGCKGTAVGVNVNAGQITLCGVPITVQFSGMSIK